MIWEKTSSTSPPSCADLLSTASEHGRPAGATELADGSVLAFWTGRAQGDQRPLRHGAAAPAPVPEDLPVRCLKQVHGAVVVTVDAPATEGLLEAWPAAADGRLPEGDALVSRQGRFCLAVLSADCATLALASGEGIFAALHVGWRGLLAGVVEKSLLAMTTLGATAVEAGLGPCIHRCCYRFEGPDRELLARRYGEDVLGVTTNGEPGVDLPRAVRVALARGGAELVWDLDRCTGCGGGDYSHRVRSDEQRQALLVWPASVQR